MLIPKSTKQNDPTKKDFLVTVMIRGVLDKCSTIKEAIEFIKKYNMHDLIGVCYHYILSDANGDSVIIEYVNNELRLLTPEDLGSKYKNVYVTNYYLSKDGNNTLGLGQERYELMKKILNSREGKSSLKELMRLLQSVRMKTTKWSNVFNLSSKTIILAINQNYTHLFEFKVSNPMEFNIIKQEFKTSAEKLSNCAKSLIGNPYVYGKSGPDSFDNIGIIVYCLKQSGIEVSRNLNDFIKNGYEVSFQRTGIIDMTYSKPGKYKNAYMLIDEKKNIVSGNYGQTLRIQRKSIFIKLLNETFIQMW